MLLSLLVVGVIFPVLLPQSVPLMRTDRQKLFFVFCGARMQWGANTDVGKTLVSCGLCRAHEKRMRERTSPGGLPQEQTWYVKPVQTGPQPWDAHKV